MSSIALSFLSDHLFSQLNSDAVQNMLAVQSQDMSRYMHLYSPAVEWILQCVAHRSPEVRTRPLTTGTHFL